jgi:hypothetical protein
MANNKYLEAAERLNLREALQSVLEAVAFYTDNQTGEAWPSLATIAGRAAVARSTAQESLAELWEMGYLAKASTRKTPRGFVNVWRVTIPTTIPEGAGDPLAVGTVPIHHTEQEPSPKESQASTIPEQEKSTIPPPYRIGTELSSSSSSSSIHPVSQEKKDNNNSKTLISTDTVPDYPQMIVDRFAKYKTPGKDALSYAKEIFVESGPGIGKGADPRQVTHLEITAGELSYRHIADLIGFVFEIQINDPKFRYAERTHTLKNLRDHLLKEKSPLESCWMDFCTDWDGHKQGNPLRTTRGSVSYAMQTMDDPEACAWGAAARKKIKESQARAKTGE